MRSKALYFLAGVAAAVFAVALTVTADSGYSIAHWVLAGFMFVWAILAFGIALSPRVHQQSRRRRSGPQPGGRGRCQGGPRYERRRTLCAVTSTREPSHTGPTVRYVDDCPAMNAAPEPFTRSVLTGGRDHEITEAGFTEAWGIRGHASGAVDPADDCEDK